MTSRAPLVALLAANVVSIAGNRLTALAVPWFVLQTTGSAAKTGVAAFFSLLPFVLSSALGGALVDRLGYRRTSILADLASGVSVLLVPVLYHTTGLPFAALLALVFAGALLDAPGQTAREAIVPELVELAGTTIERATSLLDATSRAASMIGAPLAGVLIAVVGAANVLVVDAASFAFSAVVVALLVPRVAPDARDETPYLAQQRAGFAFIWNDRLVRAILVMVLVTNMLDAAMGGVLMPVYADRVLDSVVALGLLSGFMGGGAVLGAVTYGALARRLPIVGTLVVGFALGGAIRFFVYAAEPGLVPLLAASALTGFAIGPVNPIFGTLQYARVPRAMRARVFGVVSAGVMAAAPLGALLGGLSVAALGLRATLMLFGTVYLAATLSPLVTPAWREIKDAPRLRAAAESSTL